MSIVEATVKKILIISPHFPPSNLTAVHRARLFANHLPDFGWEPIILTVDERDYEEPLDWNLYKLLPENLRIEKVRAMKITRPRIIGDIGLRAFFSIYRKAKNLIHREQIDFLYITIPSFYGALWGRWLHEATGVTYGIDYIDPWVHRFPGSEKLFSRHWLATKVAGILEPVAVKKASLISGVAPGYFKGVIERNPALTERCRFVAMPYGSEPADHEAVELLGLKPYLFEKKPTKLQLVYAGAMLPKAYPVLQQICQAIVNNREIFADLEIHFIGSGKSPNDHAGFNIKPLAEKYQLWESHLYEYPARIPYLDVLVHLNAADGVFILGSTEPHYTPSKVYQALLSRKAILAVLHEQSTGVSVIRNSKAGVVVCFKGEKEVTDISENFTHNYSAYKSFLATYDYEHVDQSLFKEYTAEKITFELISTIDEILLSKTKPNTAVC